MGYTALVENYDVLISWLLDYGSIALFILLALGIIALPIPEETLMVLSGILMAKECLPLGGTILAALGGSLTGITMSYWVGRTAGYYFLEKGKLWLGLSDHHLERAHNWFHRFGKWSLLFGYFIPGVRHFTGFTAGTTALDFRTFALFAYIGGILWVTTFLSIGYFFGDYVLDKAEKIDWRVDDFLTMGILLAAIGGIFYLYKRQKQ